MPYMEAFDYFEADISEYFGARLQFYIKDEYLFRPEPYHFMVKRSFWPPDRKFGHLRFAGWATDSVPGLAGVFRGSESQLRGFSYDELLLLAEDIRRTG
jgi:hydrophobic/amphiphilic exporter-1 (mainly G- bacteria), HAE1 family